MQAQHIAIVGLFAIILAMFIVQYFVGDKMTDAARTAWRDFAWERDLEYEPGEGGQDYGRVEGILDGREFAMWTFEMSADSGNGSETRTRMFVRPTGMPDHFIVYRREHGQVGRAIESWAFKQASRLGAEIPEPVPTGDSTFDEEWVVRGSDADAVQSWMASSDRRAALVAFLAEPHLSSGEQGLHWEGSSPTTRQEIEEIVRPLEEHAVRLENP